MSNVSVFLFSGDAFFKAAISLLPEVPRTLDVDGKIKNTEPLMVDYILNFLSTLLVIPVSGIWRCIIMQLRLFTISELPN